MFSFIELYNVGLYYGLLKEQFTKFGIPSNCHFLLEFLKMRSHGKVKIDLCALNIMKGIVGFRIVEIISILL